MISFNKLSKVLAHPNSQQICVISMIMIFRPLLMLSDKGVEFGKRIYAATREFFTELFGALNVIFVGKTAEYLLTLLAHDKAFPKDASLPKIMAAAKRFDIKELRYQVKLSKMVLGSIRKHEWESAVSTGKSLDNWKESLTLLKKDPKSSPTALKHADAVLQRLEGFKQTSPQILSQAFESIKAKNIVYSTLGVIVSCAIFTPLLNNKVINNRVLDFISGKVDRIRGVNPAGSSPAGSNTGQYTQPPAYNPDLNRVNRLNTSMKTSQTSAHNPDLNRVNQFNPAMKASFLAPAPAFSSQFRPMASL